MLAHMSSSSSTSSSHAAEKENVAAAGRTTVFRNAVCIVLEECLSDIKARIAQMDTSVTSPTGGNGNKQGWTKFANF
jgi:hypothetical protein